MSYDKDKQAWYDKERRHKLALAIIDKMEKTDREDFNLIPALNRYVETGDETMFEEFCQFHNIKDLEKKAKYIAEKTESTKDSIEYYERSKKGYEEYLGKLKKTIEAYRSNAQERSDEYDDLVRKWKDKMDAVRETLNEKNPIINQPTMADLISFCERVTKEVKQGKQRKLWLKYGNQVKPVKCFIILDDSKAVFEVGSEDLKTP
jgi:vacuolar-type H+-ATPase subunit I/STV1